MVPIRILILQKGSNKILAEWEEDPTLPKPENWEHGSSQWPEKWLNREPEQMEVFLCMNKESLAEDYDLNFIRRVIEQAHHSMWGANIYMVIESETSLLAPASNDLGTRPSTPKWFEMLVNNDVSDILQRKPTNLSQATERSLKRMDKLITYSPNRTWKCFLYKPSALRREQEAFLEPFSINSLRSNKENCLIVLQEKRDNYMRFIRKALEHRPLYSVMIGVIDQSQKPPRDLIEFCELNRYEIVWFHGLIELYYFMQKLNHINKDDATPVPIMAKPIFRSHAPQLLITHSYLTSDKNGCLAAANDTWKLIKDFRGKAKITIYPAVKCLELADIIEELGQVLAWIHIGHGDDVRGLQQAEDEFFKSAEEWLNSFAGYKSSLALAVFSSCRSAPVAKRFAEAGTGVAIGYTLDVHKKACVELTKRVVTAALESNGSRAAILEAFSIGRKRLENADPNATPVAFWASH